MIILDPGVAKHLVLPIRVLAGIVKSVGIGLGIIYCGIIWGGADALEGFQPGVESILLIIFLGALVGVDIDICVDEVLSVHDIEFAPALLYACISVKCDACPLVALAGASGDDDDTVGAPRAIDGSGGGILEDLGGSDVARGEEGYVIGDDAVDHVYRIGGIDRADASYTDFGGGTRAACQRIDGDTGGLALQGVGQRGRGGLLQLVGLHGGHRACQVTLLD